MAKICYITCAYTLYFITMSYIYVQKYTYLITSRVFQCFTKKILLRKYRK